MIKKLFFNIYTFFYHLFLGLHSANKVAFEQPDNSIGGGNSLEIQNQKDSVYKDLLKGEVTQEVVELRHEMYYSERESHNYEYAGNGRVKKKKSLFSDYGNIDDSDGYDILVIQDNMEDTGTLSSNLNEVADGYSKEREHTIKIERSFLPRFEIEEFATKVVVKKIDEIKRSIDIYITKYESQFNRRHRPFLNEIKRIKDGDTRSEVIDFDVLSFTTFNANGSSDGRLYKYGNFRFNEIYEYEGDYIIKFDALAITEGEDFIDKYYDEATAKKSENREMREGATYNMSYALEKEEDTFDVNKAQELIKELHD